ncbi:MAG: PLP-dependent aminotransferase family protein [Anaerolineae bacterium]
MHLQLDSESKLPAYMQIRNQLREQILRGDLPADAQLPPERTLAQSLGVSRTTVVSAYGELKAEGLVKGHVGRGTLVVGGAAWMDAQPIAWPAHFSSLGRRLVQHAQPAELLTLRRLSAQPDVISLALGLPDPTLLPPERLQQAWETVVERVGVAAVGTCPVQGTLAVREVIAARMRERGVTVGPEGMVLVNGSQHGLDLLLRLLAEPGDTVLVEAPTYFGALQSFLALGVRLVGVPVDEEGMDVERVEFLLARYRPRFIYTVPTYQNPTGATMSLERRERLLALSQRYQVPIVEDDPFGDLYFDQPPPPPIKTLDQHGHVLYLSTFSKSLAPGLRVGWLVASGPLVERAALLNRVTELQPNTVGQHLVVEFARQGWLEDQVALARSVYRARCQAMDAALRCHRLSGLCWVVPEGGMFLWLHLPEQVDAQHLLVETGQQGVLFLPGHLMYSAGGPRNVCRLNFSIPDQEAIEQGVATIVAALKRLLRRPAEVSDEPMVASPIV